MDFRASQDDLSILADIGRYQHMTRQSEKAGLITEKEVKTINAGLDRLVEVVGRSARAKTRKSLDTSA